MKMNFKGIKENIENLQSDLLRNYIIDQGFKVFFMTHVRHSIEGLNENKELIKKIANTKRDDHVWAELERAWIDSRMSFLNFMETTQTSAMISCGDFMQEFNSIVHHRWPDVNASGGN